MIHVPCWKLINSSTKRHSSADIYEFAQSRYPLFNTGNTFENECETLIDLTSTTAQGLNNTKLGHLLRRFLRLPAEIRSIISRNCPPSLLSSLLTISNISPQDLTKCRSGRTVIEYKDDDAGNFLCTKQAPVFSQQYLSSIAFNKDEGILVRKADFNGIRFTIWLYGLRAISILYTDGSTSDWLGDPTNGWTGVMLTNNITAFHILRDVSSFVRMAPFQLLKNCRI